MKAVYIAQVGVWRDGEKYVFDRKFYDGMLLYCNLWPGAIHCVAWEAAGPKPDFGLVARTAGQLPFKITVLRFGSPLTFDGIRNISLAVGTADDERQFSLPQLCASVPYILDMEHTPGMRRDMTAQGVRNPLRKFMRLRRLKSSEVQRREVIRSASGMACNGLAAFNCYERLSKRAIYFFDTRARRDMQISAADLERQNQAMLAGRPLRLMFSGRLINIKGIDALLTVAALLRQRNTPFTLDVFGSGEMEREVISAARKDSAIGWRGAVDFETALMPALKSDFDLFVCCHRQGDPSCTYLETFAAGVPMVGFANESLAPLSILSNAAATVPMDDVKGLADVITRLHDDRPKLVAMSQKAADFSKAHTFESEFEKRIDFWKQIALT